MMLQILTYSLFYSKHLHTSVLTSSSIDLTPKTTCYANNSHMLEEWHAKTYTQNLLRSYICFIIFPQYF